MPASLGAATESESRHMTSDFGGPRVSGAILGRGLDRRFQHGYSGDPRDLRHPVTRFLKMILADDPERASSAILEAAASGELTSDEAQSAMALLVARKSVVQTSDHERRLAAIEAKINSGETINNSG